MLFSQPKPISVINRTYPKQPGPTLTLFDANSRKLSEISETFSIVKVGKYIKFRVI